MVYFTFFSFSVIREQASHGLFQLTKIDSQHVIQNGWYNNSYIHLHHYYSY